MVTHQVTTLIPWKKRVLMPMLQLIEMKKHTSLTIHDSERKLVKADFIYDKENVKETCPYGQIVPFKKLTQDNRRIYQGTAETCANCPYHKRCCQSKKGEARTITTDSYEPLRQK